MPIWNPHNDAYPDDIRPFAPPSRYEVHHNVVRSAYEVIDTKDGSIDSRFWFESRNGYKRQIANNKAARRCDRLNGDLDVAPLRLFQEREVDA